MYSGTVLHVAHGIHAATGGAAQAILRICRETALAGWQARLVALDLSGEVEIPEDVDVRLYAPTGPRRLGYSRALARDLPRLIGQADLVHTHFLWSEPMWSAWRYTHQLNKPLVLQTHGALMPAAWRRHRLMKTISFMCHERSALRRAKLLLATSALEADILQSTYGAQRVAVIPLGTDPPPSLPSHSSAREHVMTDLGRPCGSRYILYLGRIDAHKQVDVLIRALSLLRGPEENVPLVLVGPVSPRLRLSLGALACRLGVQHRVIWQDGTFGREKWRYFRGATVCALPSRSENFGLVVAESLAVGTPVVASRTTPWSALSDHGLGDWTNTDADSFAAAFRRIFRQPEPVYQLQRTACRQYATDNLTWSASRKALVSAYANAIDAGTAIAASNR